MKAEAFCVRPHQKTQGLSNPRTYLYYRNCYLFDRFQLSSCPSYAFVTLLAVPGMKGGELASQNGGGKKKKETKGFLKR